MKREYDIQMEDGDIDEDSGRDFFFSSVFDKVLFHAIDTNNIELAKRMLEFVDEMENDSDHSAAEVAESTVFAELCDRDSNDGMIPLLKETSEEGFAAVRNYFPVPESKEKIWSQCAFRRITSFPVDGLLQ